MVRKDVRGFLQDAVFSLPHVVAGHVVTKVQQTLVESPPAFVGGRPADAWVKTCGAGPFYIRLAAPIPSVFKIYIANRHRTPSVPFGQ